MAGKTDRDLGDNRSRSTPEPDGAGIFTAIGDAFESFANWLGDVIIGIGNFLGDLLERFGNAILDFFNVLGRIPGIGEVFKWIGDVIGGAINLVGVVVKGGMDIVGDAVRGGIKIVGGILTGDGGMIKEGAIDIAAGVAGGVLLIVGEIISYVQTVFFIQGRKRSLTDAEQNMLNRVFRGSISLSTIRVVDGRTGLFALNGTEARALTLGNTIYMKHTNPATYPETLVHECVHVWQNQHVGSRYIPEALWAQGSLGNNAYLWEQEITLRGKTSWTQFNREAQAQFIEDIFTDGELVTGTVVTDNEGVFFDAVAGVSVGRFVRATIDRTALANEAVGVVRRAASAQV